MNNHDHSHLSDPVASSRALTPRVAAVESFDLAHHAAGPMDGAAHGHGAGLSTYLNALRRRWLPALMLGLTLGAGGFGGVWFTMKPTFTAMASFYVAATPKAILFNTEERAATNFEIYKNTQVQYVKSRFVLIAALRKPDVAGLTVLRDEADPIDWLVRNLRVDFPGNGEIMNISVKTEDPREAQVLVNAVVDAYQTEVLNVETRQRQQRLTEVEKIKAEKETQLLAKRNELKNLASNYGSGKGDTLNLKQQIALQQYAAFRGELMQSQFKLMRLRGELKARQEESDRTGGAEASEVELDVFVQADPLAAPLLAKYNELRQKHEEVERVYTGNARTAQLKRLETVEQTTKNQLTARRAQLKEELLRRKKSTASDGLDKLRSEIAMLVEQEKQLQKDVDAAKKQAEAFGGSSVNAETAAAEIAQLEGLLRTINDEREKLAIEIRNRPRVSEINRVDAPPVAADKDRKLQLTILATLSGFLFPFGLIIWWDARARRINSPVEVTFNTGLNVIGAVPLLPARAMPHSMAATARGRHWRERLNESVDSIAARLLHMAEHDQTRMVLVSSAVSGEGKTTLSTQLALSLARTGHRTLLVDFDLRRPAIDRVFALPLEPGVAATLRKEVPYHEAIVETAVDNLSVLPAGRGDRRLMSVLANGAVKSLLDQLRLDFEFVVVDGCPILPVADARFLCQHVDGVVLSVLRDVSSVPNILAACDVLAGFGVQPIGAVVTGSAGDTYYHARYVGTSS